MLESSLIAKITKLVDDNELDLPSNMETLSLDDLNELYENLTLKVELIKESEVYDDILEKYGACCAKCNKSVNHKAYAKITFLHGDCRDEFSEDFIEIKNSTLLSVLVFAKQYQSVPKGCSIL